MLKVHKLAATLELGSKKIFDVGMILQLAKSNEETP